MCARPTARNVALSDPQCLEGCASGVAQGIPMWTRVEVFLSAHNLPAPLLVSNVQQRTSTVHRTASKRVSAHVVRSLRIIRNSSAVRLPHDQGSGYRAMRANAAAVVFSRYSKQASNVDRPIRTAGSPSLDPNTGWVPETLARS